MDPSVAPNEVISSLLLVKALLAILAVMLFIYYRYYWEKAKRHLQIHFFYAKWRTVRLAFALGLASIGYAVGFSLELFSDQLGFSPAGARFFSNLFEIGSLFAMLWVFFNLVLEDVPQLKHVWEAARSHKHQAVAGAVLSKAAKSAQAKKERHSVMARHARKKTAKRKRR